MLNQFEVSLAVKSYCLGESGFQREKRFFFLAQKAKVKLSKFYSVDFTERHF